MHSKTQTESLKAREVNLPNRLLTLDLGKLSRSCTYRVDGLIGADFFAGRIVQIDFRTSKATLLASGTQSAGQASPLEVRHSAISLKASINGKRAQWFRVDTGCATPVQWVTGDAGHQCSPFYAQGRRLRSQTRSAFSTKPGRVFILSPAVSAPLHGVLGANVPVWRSPPLAQE
jgi:hypothetical protein